MKKLFRAIIIILFFISLIGCSTIPKNTITQVSTIDALLVGLYDGHLSCQEILKYGDFGLGTFNRLDGEMILLDGNLYQIKADGTVLAPALDITTPFAAVSRFEADKTFYLKKEVNFKQLEEIINNKVPNMNIFCSIKAKGTFLKMKTRSVPSQEKPYPPLIEVVKNQPIFKMEDIAGSIVGFRCPAYVKGINVPGYHLHFISDDLTHGGHILDFTTNEVIISLDTCNKFFLIVPDEKSGFDKIDLEIDRGKDLEKVEMEAEK